MMSLLLIYMAKVLNNVVLLDVVSIGIETIGVIVGILSILGSIFFVIFKTGKIVNKLETLDDTVKELKVDFKEMKSDVNILKSDVHGLKYDVNILKMDVHGLKKNVSSLNKHMNAVIERVNILWSNRNPLEQSKSPKQLSDIGKKILKESNIEGFIKQHFDDIVAKVKTSKPQNRYQAQEAIIEIIREFGDDDKYINYLEESAFESGTNVDSVLYVAALHFRDEITSKLNLKSREIDKHFTSA